MYDQQTDPKYFNFGSNSYIWSQIYRMNLTEYENPIPPSVTEYTLLSKKETFALFGIMVGLQTFVVFLAKLLVSKPFRKLNFLVFKIWPKRAVPIQNIYIFRKINAEK